MELYEIQRALSKARSELKAVEDNASIMADLIAGNLRSIPAYKLKRLKKELRDFNMHTQTWMR